jgi:hypothetical protein
MMGTSIEQIEMTYGHLLRDALERGRAALETFDAKADAKASSWLRLGLQSLWSADRRDVGRSSLVGGLVRSRFGQRDARDVRWLHDTGGETEIVEEFMRDLPPSEEV